MLSIVRANTYLREKTAKIRMTWFYNGRIKDQPLKEGDMVLRKMESIKKGAI